jgi:ankyrin repeat protein
VSRNLGDMVALLLKLRADPNALNDSGMTPLHLAAHQGNFALAELLLAHGARKNVKDEQGRTPLDLAQLPTPDPARQEERAAVAKLLESGAS